MYFLMCVRMYVCVVVVCMYVRMYVGKYVSSMYLGETLLSGGGWLFVGGGD